MEKLLATLNYKGSGQRIKEKKLPEPHHEQIEAVFPPIVRIKTAFTRKTKEAKNGGNRGAGFRF